MIAPDFPAECTGFLRSGPVRLTAVYGDWRGRLWPNIQLGVLSPDNPDEAFLVTTSSGYPQRRRTVWHRVDVARGTLLESHNLGIDTASPVDLRSDGALVAILGRGDGTLRIRTNTGEFRWKRGGGWRSARFLRTSDRILAEGVQGVIVEFDVASGAELSRMRGFAPTLSLDERLMAYLPDRHHVALWDRAESRELARWTTVPQYSAPGPDGSLVGLRFLDRDTGELFRLRPGERRPVWRVDVPVRWSGLEFRLDQGTVVVNTAGYRLADGAPTPYEDQRAVLSWDVAVYYTRTARPSTGHPTAITAIACSPDGAVVATTGDPTVRVWDTTSTRQIRCFDGVHRGGDPTVHFSDDSRTLVVLCRHSDDRQRWRVADGTSEAFPLPLPPKYASVRVSGDGRLLLVEDAQDMWDTELQVIRIADGTVLWRATEGLPMRSTGVRQPGGAVFVGADVLAFIWIQSRPGKPFRPRILRVHGSDVDTVILRGVGSGAAALARHSWMHVAFSADGTRMAITHRQVLVFDTRTGAVLVRLDTLTNRPPVFVGTRWLLTVDLDEHVQVFDLAERTPPTILALDSAGDTVESLCGAPDGTSVLIGTRRGVLLRFALDDAAGAPVTR